MNNEATMTTTIITDARGERIYTGPSERYHQSLECTRGGLHNVDMYAVGVVTTLDRVGRCVATYARQSYDPGIRL